MKKTVDNCKDHVEYDNYLKKYIVFYTVTEFLGIGKYSKKNFIHKIEAKKFLTEIRTQDPNKRCLMYGVSRPPHTVLDVSIPMEESQ
jgi:hypothetical protein